MTLQEALKQLECFSLEKCKQKCEEKNDCPDCYIDIDQVKAIDVLRNKVKEMKKENLELSNKYNKALSHLVKVEHERIVKGVENEC